ncbi:tetratricopeptide repeat protein [Catellatospora sp. NPDC049609]|uniref:tetratricopeptide repeat protein n=1 Tax=Catellatospora sp. NPDC049609 TaxID=3155505 RepID=UPI00344874C0
MPEGGRLARARELVRRLDFPAAQQLLRDQLALAHQDPRHADAAEADTAALYAGVLLHLGEPHAARSWAAYAHAAAQALHGDLDRRTLHALGVLAVTMHRTGALDRAAELYQDLIRDLSLVDGPDSDRALSARADAAVVEHARGSCVDGRRHLAEALAAYTSRHGPSHPVTVRMTIRLAGMWRDCGDFDQAHELLARARAQVAAVPAGDEVHRLLQAAARAQAQVEHRCGASPPEEQAAGARDPGPGVLPVLVPHPDDLIPGPHRTAAASAAADPAEEWPDDEIFERYDDPARIRRTRHAPSPDDPSAGATGRPDDTGPDDTWPDRSGDPAWPGRSGEQPPAWPGRSGEQAPAWTGAQVPARREELPFPVPTTPPPGLRTSYAPPVRRRRGAGAAALAVCAALVAIIALVGTFLLAAGPDPGEGTAPPAATSAAPAASAPPAATGLAVADEDDRLLVTWSYPDGVAAAVVLSAAPAGEPMRAMQSLPAGTESFTLLGLDPRRDYCVTVTLAYSAEQTVMSPPVCTDRRRSPAARP